MRLGTLKVKVGNIEGGIKPWVDAKLENKDRWVQV